MVPVNRRSACLHHLIEARTRDTPDAPALAFEGRTLTYRELDARAARLAGKLAALGAGNEALVGLLVERSLEMIVGILGVLKAGAAYVPIDPAYPQERVAFMVADAGVKVLLTQASLAARAPREATAVLLDAFDWSGAPVAPGARGVGPDNLAYVIYTSGSTGRPKGVCIEHRNIVSYVLGVAERLRLEPGMRHATVSTIAADLGNTVIFPALATGGCLHVVSQERSENQALLAEYLCRERIDVLKIVPSHLAALQSGADPRKLMPRKRLILGGEASRIDWIARLRAAAPQCEVFNHYGPTEATVGALTYAAGEVLPVTPSGTLPLGKPLAGCRVHLLDEQRRPVAVGEKGELYIGGSGVARGYLNRPELSAQRFIPDPFAPEPGARLYRTGDLARVLPDGNVEFCGRVDHQVKLHGYRVELGEIESALREHAAVREAAVLARDDGSGDKQLVACIGGDVAPAVLREHLKARLPHYMVPSAFVVMPRLPLTANGKIDRQALAAASTLAGRPARAGAPPRSATEETLVTIWSELLGVERVGLDDDLFDLGAHSLMAMKAVTRMREAFGVDLALRNLFEHPTVAGLAALLDGLASLQAPRAPAVPGGEREEIVL